MVLEDPGFSLGDGTQQFGFDARPDGVGVEVPDPPAQDLLPAHPHALAGPIVDAHVAPVAVEGDEPVADASEHSLEALLGRPGPSSSACSRCAASRRSRSISRWARTRASSSRCAERLDHVVVGAGLQALHGATPRRPAPTAGSRGSSPSGGRTAAPPGGLRRLVAATSRRRAPGPAGSPGPRPGLPRRPARPPLRTAVPGGGGRSRACPRCRRPRGIEDAASPLPSGAGSTPDDLGAEWAIGDASRPSQAVLGERAAGGLLVGQPAEALLDEGGRPQCGSRRRAGRPDRIGGQMGVAQGDRHDERAAPSEGALGPHRAAVEPGQLLDEGQADPGPLVRPPRAPSTRWNRSKMRGSSSAGMPVPVSRTDSSTAPSTARGRRRPHPRV